MILLRRNHNRRPRLGRWFGLGGEIVCETCQRGTGSARAACVGVSPRECLRASLARGGQRRREIGIGTDERRRGRSVTQVQARVHSSHRRRTRTRKSARGVRAGGCPSVRRRGKREVAMSGQPTYTTEAPRGPSQSVQFHDIAQGARHRLARAANAIARDCLVADVRRSRARAPAEDLWNWRRAGCPVRRDAVGSDTASNVSIWCQRSDPACGGCSQLCLRLSAAGDFTGSSHTSRPTCLFYRSGDQSWLVECKSLCSLRRTYLHQRRRFV